MIPFYFCRICNRNVHAIGSYKQCIDAAIKEIQQQHVDYPPNSINDRRTQTDSQLGHHQPVLKQHQKR